MPIDVVAQDKRLESKAPATSSGAIRVDVGADTRLDEFFERLDRESKMNRGLGTLYIVAPSIYVAVDDLYAIQFCSEYISYRTTSYFERLRDEVKQIVLFVFAAADSDVPRRGDPDVVCSELAKFAKAEVLIARKVEKNKTLDGSELFYCDLSSIEFGEWEGTVSRYNDRGQLVGEYHNPGFSFVENGTLRDPCIADPITLNSGRT